MDNMRHISWDMWIRNNFKYLKWSSRSFKVINVSAIRQATYDFILVFHRIYVSIPFSRYYRLFIGKCHKNGEASYHILALPAVLAIGLLLSNSNHTIITFKMLLLHFAWVVDDAKCIVVTRVCVSVCLSVRGRTPTLLHWPGCILGAW